MNKYPMTVQGARALEEELAHLTKVRRPALSQAIAEARELGDLKENAEYHAAREEQGMVEARIRDIEGRLQHAVVIDVTTIPHSGKVIFGNSFFKRSSARTSAATVWAGWDSPSMRGSAFMAATTRGSREKSSFLRLSTCACGTT